MGSQTLKSNAGPVTHPIPSVLGRYEIVGILGRGGMATVYLGRSAREAGFSRLFAVKVLHPHLADDDGFVSMLLDEGQIAARLHHPNVVPIVDLGSQGDLRYVVLEYVEGCSLSALLAKHRDSRPPRLVVPIVLDALSGLHAAHSLTDDDGSPMQLVHRDVSPQNILVGADGAARITDFGIAKADSRITTTRPGEIKGKVLFMSPEQIRGRPVDLRSDLFSAGCLLWSALTGRRLFTGENDAETMMNILEMKVPPPSTMGLAPPPAFDAICLRALERDPDARWSSAAEMEEALRAVALEHGLLGSRREVSAWVTGAFGDELTARRAAIRVVATRGQPASLSDVEPASTRLRVIPGIEPSDVDMDFASSTPRPGAPQSHAAPVGWRDARGRVRLFATIAGATLAGALGVWLLMRTHDVGAAGHVAPVAAATPAPAAPPPLPLLAPVSPVPTAVETTTAAAIATTTATPTVPRPAETSALVPPKGAATRSSPATGASPAMSHSGGDRRPAASTCDPPYVVDGNGIEHFKPGCL
jgi:eukaryotic-like serine/threonine-protein kinase